MVCPALAVTIADLEVPGVTITSGDKTFFGFHAYGSGGTGGAGGVLDSQITVTPILENGEYGLLFTSSFFHVTAGQSQDTAFHFFVTPASGFYITDNTLELGGAHISGDAEIAVIETALKILPNDQEVLLASKLVTMDQSSSVFKDHQVYSQPASLVEVHKDISLFGGTDGTARFSDFTQTFSQTPVPEPLTMLGVIAGVGSMGGYIRRRKA